MAESKVAEKRSKEEQSAFDRQYARDKSPYDQWKESEGLPTVKGYFVQNLHDMELTPWNSRGGSGVFINLVGTGGLNDTYVCEIPPGKSLNPIKHLYEESVFILKGRGATTVWLDEEKKQTFEWGERSYFALPPNAWYQHHNGSGMEPVRYVAMTMAPRVINQAKSLEFVFNNPYVFTDRFIGEDGYFQQTEEPTGRGEWATNFVDDVLAHNEMPNELPSAKVRRLRSNPLNTTRSFAMVNGTINSHSSSWPIGTYKKAHRHGPGFHVTILRGQGYSLMWKDNGPMERIDWGPGSMLVPPEDWFHQHFNVGAEPVLFLALGSNRESGWDYVEKSVKEGGDRMGYEDEDPQIHRDFEAALAKAGVTCRMGELHPLCTQK